MIRRVNELAEECGYEKIDEEDRDTLIKREKLSEIQEKLIEICESNEGLFSVSLKDESEIILKRKYVQEMVDALEEGSCCCEDYEVEIGATTIDPNNDHQDRFLGSWVLSFPSFMNQAPGMYNGNKKPPYNRIEISVMGSVRWSKEMTYKKQPSDNATSEDDFMYVLSDEFWEEVEANSGPWSVSSENTPTGENGVYTVETTVSGNHSGSYTWTSDTSGGPDRIRDLSMSLGQAIAGPMSPIMRVQNSSESAELDIMMKLYCGKSNGGEGGEQED